LYFMPPLRSPDIPDPNPGTTWFQLTA
jgi:hypothetical protein